WAGLAWAGLAWAGLAWAGLAWAVLVTTEPAISGGGTNELPGTPHTAVRAGPGVVRTATAEGIQRANRPRRKKVLRADFIAAPSH
ncbi:MAG TPA: hypothetical protein VF933_02805, partial [Streptosporangiaceae bacterium]